MADYEIVAVRLVRGKRRTQHVDAVKVGESLFLADQIIDWIKDGTHRFWVWFQNVAVEVVIKEQGSSRRYYLTVAGGGFPPTALLSLPRV